jgi:glycosyltransferase involved in cell wall biosynthesis
MHFFIVTPSFNQLSYLKRCVASIRDQTPSGATVEHWVIDGGSKDGTTEWLRAEGVQHISEPDSGMYDALNKGLKKMCECDRKDIVFSWLNCDEQYLPGALEAVAHYLRHDCTADIICGDALLVNRDGGMLAYWKSIPLRRHYLQAGSLYNLTCSMFFRAGRIAGCDLRFDTTFKAIADRFWVDKWLAMGARSVCIRQFCAAYTFESDNISNRPEAAAERSGVQAIRSKLAKPLLRALRAGERWFLGVRKQSFPLSYALFIDDLRQRRVFSVDSAPSKWPTLKV